MIRFLPLAVMILVLQAPEDDATAGPGTQSALPGQVTQQSQRQGVVLRQCTGSHLEPLTLQ